MKCTNCETDVPKSKIKYVYGPNEHYPVCSSYCEQEVITAQVMLELTQGESLDPGYGNLYDESDLESLVGGY